MTDGQSASWSLNKAPIWGLRPDCQTVTGLLVWGALSDEKMGLPFKIAAVSRQCIHSRVRVPWDSWAYFAVSDPRLPFLSPPTTRRATVEVFDPASTRGEFILLWTASSTTYQYSRKCLLIPQQCVVFKNPSLRKRLCHSFPSNGSACHNINRFSVLRKISLMMLNIDFWSKFTPFLM
jgi:hypothetical protein